MPLPLPHPLPQLLASHSVSAVFSGHLHSSFGERLHRVHATPAGGRMAELETAAWKVGAAAVAAAAAGGRHAACRGRWCHGRRPGRVSPHRRTSTCPCACVHAQTAPAGRPSLQAGGPGWRRTHLPGPLLPHQPRAAHAAPLRCRRNAGRGCGGRAGGWLLSAGGSRLCSNAFAALRRELCGS